MFVEATEVGDELEMTRADMDKFALRSHQLAVQATDEGRLPEEIVAVTIKSKKGDPVLLSVDESPREDTTLEALARLKPAFKEGGTVTAGNAPGVNDGAAALVVTSADTAKELGTKPLARIVAQSVAGIEPSLVMMAPVGAVQKLWKKTGWSPESVDLVELNEAFAVQAIAVARELKLDPAKVNVNGGAVALGHPIGASGARVLTTLLYALKDRGLKRGVAALCLGGGNGVALAVELV
jgi:acetyl-CoA C-acetyltransferase